MSEKVNVHVCVLCLLLFYIYFVYSKQVRSPKLTYQFNAALPDSSAGDHSQPPDPNYKFLCNLELPTANSQGHVKVLELE